jgi:hypothetical protein
MNNCELNNVWKNQFSLKDYISNNKQILNLVCIVLDISCIDF